MYFPRLVPVVVLFAFLLLSIEPQRAVAQEPLFELPVQLVGFPVIILAVRFSNFVKKLAYSLNPQTYTSSGNDNSLDKRSKRELPSVDASEAERRLVESLGSRVCVLERECVQHAVRGRRRSRGRSAPSRSGLGEQPDWEEILSGYKRTSNAEKEWYLLSVFLGDIMKSPDLCRQLAKRRPCAEQHVVS